MLAVLAEDKFSEFGLKKNKNAWCLQGSLGFGPRKAAYPRSEEAGG